MRGLPPVAAVAVCTLLAAAPTGAGLALFGAADAQAATVRPKLLHVYATQALKGKTMVVTAQFSAPASDGVAKAKICVSSHCGSATVPSGESYDPQVMLQHFDEVGHKVTIKISLTISGTRFTYSERVTDTQSEMG
jgi:hypothetical protein